jgi:hypothetical protein
MARSSMDRAAARSAPTTPAPGVSAIRTDPIRTTLDLDPDLWGDVGEWLSINQSAMRKKITFVKLIRVMLRLLTTDAQFADKVREML